MSLRQRSRWMWRLPMALFGAAAILCYAGVSGLSAPDEKPWTGYGGHADSSRYFDSKQITKTNVQQLQVAWTYPYSDSGGYPIVVRGVVYGRASVVELTETQMSLGLVGQSEG